MHGSWAITLLDCRILPRRAVQISVFKSPQRNCHLCSKWSPPHSNCKEPSTHTNGHSHKSRASLDWLSLIHIQGAQGYAGGALHDLPLALPLALLDHLPYLICLVHTQGAQGYVGGVPSVLHDLLILQYGPLPQPHHQLQMRKSLLQLDHRGTIHQRGEVRNIHGETILQCLDA